MRLLLFGSPKCNPCNVLKKEFQRKNIPFIYVNVEENEELARDYMVTSFPTIVIENGKGEIKELYVGNGNKVWEILKKYKIIKEES